MSSTLVTFIDNDSNICKLDLRESESNRRIIAGYANVSDLVDSQGDVVTHEALMNGWSKWKENPDFCILSLLHSNVPIAKIIFEEVVDSKGNLHRSGVDDKGLYIVAEVRSDITVSNDVWKKIENGELRGFSIGGRNLNPQPVKCDNVKCVREINSLELHEVAIVDQPANRVSIFNMLKRDDLAKLADATKNLPEQILVEGALKISKKPCPDSGHYHILVKEGIPEPKLCSECFAIIKQPKEDEEYVDLFDLALLRPESVLTGEPANSGYNQTPLKAETPDKPTPPGGTTLENEENKEVKTEEEESKDDSGESEAPEETSKEEAPAIAPITLETIAADLARLNERLDAMEKRDVEKVEKSVAPAEPAPAPAEAKPTEVKPEQTPPVEAKPAIPVIQAPIAPPQEPPTQAPEPTTSAVKPLEPVKPVEQPKPAQTEPVVETRGVNPQAVQTPRGDPLIDIYRMPWKTIHEAMNASPKR